MVGKVGKVFWDSGFLGAGLSQMKGEWEGLSAEEERREAPSEGVCGGANGRVRGTGTAGRPFIIIRALISVGATIYTSWLGGVYGVQGR